MHLADAFIQFMHSLGIEPMTLALQADALLFATAEQNFSCLMIKQKGGWGWIINLNLSKKKKKRKDTCFEE